VRTFATQNQKNSSTIIKLMFAALRHDGSTLIIRVGSLPSIAPSNYTQFAICALLHTVTSAPFMAARDSRQLASRLFGDFGNRLASARVARIKLIQHITECLAVVKVGVETG
jgi:hypothetical protein